MSNPNKIKKGKNPDSQSGMSSKQKTLQSQRILLNSRATDFSVKTKTANNFAQKMQSTDKFSVTNRTSKEKAYPQSQFD
jgi:hypothetical protein